MGEKDNGQPIFVNGKEFALGGIPELTGDFLISPSDNSGILKDLVGSRDGVLEIHVSLGPFNANIYPFNTLWTNNWRKHHGLRMRRRKR